MRQQKRAIVAVTNDLGTDRRVARTCDALLECGYKVILVGRKLPGMLPMDRPYKVIRMGLLFRKGALFYAEYNLRLFLLLLFKRYYLCVCNDLDTLLAGRMAQRLKGGELLYDSHEYFTEVPELIGRKARNTWLRIERSIFPKLRYVITVNDSIADEYMAKYGVRPQVVRNLAARPRLNQVPTRAALGIPSDKTVLIMQGSGINLDRGGEEAVLAMRELPECYLLIIGSGDAWPTLKALVQQYELQQRVRLINRIPYSELMHYTANADLGLSLDKNTNLNYRYSLPNKLFDYLYAGIPVLATDLPELSKVISAHDAGILVPNPNPETLVNAIVAFIQNPSRRQKLKQNAKFAAANLNPEKEKEILRNLIKQIGS